ncbi:MAG: Ldh family oxidoreductase [Moorella humiferrea]|nr:Ldh family oxidoreductase [Moorella humiferrea]
MKIKEINRLTEFCAAVLVRAGLPGEHAGLVARFLVEADMRGHATHGVSRLGSYIERVEKGVMNPAPDVKVIREAPAVALLDGDNGFGQVVVVKAMDLALKKAKNVGTGIIAVKNSNHAGELGLISLQAAENHMIGFTLSNTSPVMAPWGGREPVLGNNPLAIAIPRQGYNPIIIDLAFSVTARGNIILADKEGRPIPPGWAVNPQGEPTTDAREALLGSVLPMACHKGFALALMVEILTSVLAGGPVGPEVGSLVPADLSKPLGISHLVGAIDIKHFLPTELFWHHLENLLKYIKNSKPAKDSRGIYIPGELSARRREKALHEGIELEAATLKELYTLGKKYSIQPFF